MADGTVSHMNNPTPSVRRRRAERLEIVDVYEAPACGRCLTPLEPISEDIVGEDGTWRHLQAKNALLVSFDGAYGMAVDPIDHIDRDSLTTLICRSCVDALIDAEPWIGGLLANHLAPVR